MSEIVLLNKPYNYLSQFTPEDGKHCLADIFIQEPLATNFYPAGRLDCDSEGLLLLTNDGNLQHHITSPAHKMRKTYWVQVEGDSNTAAIAQLKKGITLNDGPTQPAKVSIIDTPSLWARTPPIRQRRHVSTHWLSLTISEGRNRQVRRMTAAVGLPTLRLIRVAIGAWQLGNLQPGEYRKECVHLPTPKNPRQIPKKHLTRKKHL